jgi:hypothetical protein
MTLCMRSCASFLSLHSHSPPSRSTPHALDKVSTLLFIPDVEPVAAGGGAIVQSPSALAWSSRKVWGTSRCSTSLNVMPVWAAPSLSPAAVAPPTMSNTVSHLLAAFSLLLIILSQRLSMGGASITWMGGRAASGSAVSIMGSRTTEPIAVSAVRRTVTLWSFSAMVALDSMAMTIWRSPDATGYLFRMSVRDILSRLDILTLEGLLNSLEYAGLRHLNTVLGTRVWPPWIGQRVSARITTNYMSVCICCC